MKDLERYYRKIYKCTNKLLQKVFGLDVEDSMVELNKSRKEIEEIIKKDIGKITTEDLIKNKLTFKYCKYRTLNNILSVISGASFLNAFCDEDIEVVKNER